MDFGAIVIGAGHNGLICAAYLARAGIRTLVIEARAEVGGQASTEVALGGARVNICNCDHTMVRTTTIPEELGLAKYGLRYLDAEPSQLNVHWDGGPGWFVFHDIERTIESLRISYPSEVENYRRYLKSALPMARMIADISQSVPTPGAVLGSVGRSVVAASKAVPALLSWSRKSVADVVRAHFDAEQVRTPVVTTGPSVWGLSPETPGTGLGALGYAMKHIAPTGRPVGGSGALPTAIALAFESFGGTLRCSATVAEIVCEDDSVRGVRLADGELIEAPIVVSAADSHNALVQWLKNPPAAALPLIERYRAMPSSEGYESKIDAVLDARYAWKAVDDTMRSRLVLSDVEVLHPTTIVSKSLGELATDHAASKQGRIAARPQFYAQLPSALDPSVAAALPPGSEVFSLEVLWTPYALEGGWAGSAEPQRWLDAVSELVHMADGRPLTQHIVSSRLMGPEDYDRRFSMPKGHAQSFAGTPFTALLGRDREQTRYETPVRGLFLTGAGTFPGAGVWGASGRNTATAILASDGRSARARRSVRAAVA